MLQLAIVSLVLFLPILADEQGETGRKCDAVGHATVSEIQKAQLDLADLTAAVAPDTAHQAGVPATALPDTANVYVQKRKLADDDDVDFIFNVTHSKENCHVTIRWPTSSSGIDIDRTEQKFDWKMAPDETVNKVETKDTGLNLKIAGVDFNLQVLKVQKPSGFTPRKGFHGVCVVVVTGSDGLWWRSMWGDIGGTTHDRFYPDNFNDNHLHFVTGTAHKGVIYSLSGANEKCSPSDAGWGTKPYLRYDCFGSALKLRRRRVPVVDKPKKRY